MALDKYLKVKKIELDYIKKYGKEPRTADLADIAGLDYEGKGRETKSAKHGNSKPSGAATAGRETLKAANNVIKYVAYGQFPVTKPDKFFERKSDLEKVATLPKVSDYLRFGENLIYTIHGVDNSYARFPKVRRDVDPTQEELERNR